MSNYTYWFKKYIDDVKWKLRKSIKNIEKDFESFPDNRLPVSYGGNGNINGNHIFGSTFNPLSEYKCWELMKSLNNKQNVVGVFKLHPDDILYTMSVHFLLEMVYNFYSTYANSPNIIEEKEKLEYVRGQIHEVPKELLYTKFFALTRDYFLNGEKFKFPVTAHYIPGHDKWRLHPGGFRQVILGLFKNSEIEVLGLYNKERDQDKEFLQQIGSLDEVRSYFNIPDDTQLDLNLTGLGGRVLPNFAFDYVRYHSAFPIEFTDLIQFLDKVNIGSNFNFYHNSRFQDKVERTIYIKSDNPTNLASILKALLILPFFDSPDAPKIKGIKFEEIDSDIVTPPYL